jgi:hypothetical protein
MAEDEDLSFGNVRVNSQSSTDGEGSCLTGTVLALGLQVLEHVSLRLLSNIWDSDALNFRGLREAEAVCDSLLNFFRDLDGLIVPTLLVVDESTVKSLLDDAVLSDLDLFNSLSISASVLEFSALRLTFLLRLDRLGFVFDCFDHYFCES